MLVDMSTDASKIIQNLHSKALAFANTPLFALPSSQHTEHPSRIINLTDGYISPLTNYTFEDRAAKGLRKRKPGAKPEPAVYITALEVVRDNKITFLTGPSGSGKTVFGKWLSWKLAKGDGSREVGVVRNEGGEVKEEVWDGKGSGWYWKITSKENLEALVKETVPGLLAWHFGEGTAEELIIVVDGVEEAGDEGAELLTELVAVVKEYEKVRLLLLGRDDVCKSWVLSLDVERHDLLSLLHITRKQTKRELLGTEADEKAIGMGAAAANAALFAMAVEAASCGSKAEELLDIWLSATMSGEQEINELAAKAFLRFEHGTISKSTTQWPSHGQPSHLLAILVVRRFLAARHLSKLSSEKAVHLFHQDPKTWGPIIRSQLARLDEFPEGLVLVSGLIQGQDEYAQRGALLVSSSKLVESANLRDRVLGLILEIVERGTLSTVEREKAGRVLSGFGDPRDLNLLIDVDATTFTMGSESHPNSQPVFDITLNSYRIGAYPVVNRDYSAFINGTGRTWYSPARNDPDKQNFPATDLTWHDAVAYCAWLTDRWRASGKIEVEEQIRLPTEPEWENAARGNQKEVVQGELVYPWGTTWHNDAANGEESGLNAPCTVGLFRCGRSPFGCYDMAGNIWEWCSTLWGEDMSTPSFAYPYQPDDGREAMSAPEKLRRVLRGGCFSSGKLKATCVYRGSLEPAGFWRGNGFRIVVARAT